MRFNRKRSEKNRLNAQRRGRLSGIARAAKRLTNGPQDEEPRRRDAGEYLGRLEWFGADGLVRRWPVFQAKRKNQICVAGLNKGWDWLLRRLRTHLSPLTR